MGFTEQVLSLPEKWTLFCCDVTQSEIPCSV